MKKVTRLIISEAQWSNIAFSFKNNIKDNISGGLGDKHTPQSLAQKHGVNLTHINNQLNWGRQVEKKEHGEHAFEIALDHVTEDPNYYRELSMIDNEAREIGNRLGLL